MHFKTENFRDESAAFTFFYESEKKYSEDKKSTMQFRKVDENVGGSHLVVRKRQVLKKKILACKS